MAPVKIKIQYQKSCDYSPPKSSSRESRDDVQYVLYIHTLRSAGGLLFYIKLYLQGKAVGGAPLTRLFAPIQLLEPPPESGALTYRRNSVRDRWIKPIGIFISRPILGELSFILPICIYHIDF